MTLVNKLRERVKEWRNSNYPGVTRTTLDLLTYWNRADRHQRLFFTQREAAETIIFLTEPGWICGRGFTFPLMPPPTPNSRRLLVMPARWRRVQGRQR
ncbi:hypothetical protein NON20_25630 (plasmid) [Synechocystis sp. B12]|nr:hypothetical protein NON20_25630 [Synechocystis sp. B12]